VLTIIIGLLLGIFSFKFLNKLTCFKFLNNKTWKILFIVAGFIIGLSGAILFQINCPKKKYISGYEEVSSIQTKQRIQGNFFTGFKTKTYYEYYVKGLSGSLLPKEINFEDVRITYTDVPQYVMTTIREMNKEKWMNYIGLPIDRYVFNYFCVPKIQSGSTNLSKPNI
jgi:hypothetical protein